MTRCRFDDLELLAGAGTFLPRRVSEGLVSAADERIARVENPLLVDVGTGCGAVALALARRHPRAQVLGLDLDAGALAGPDATGGGSAHRRWISPPARCSIRCLAPGTDGCQ